MTIDEILRQLLAERDRLDQAIRALQGSSATEGARRGRKPARAANTGSPRRRGRPPLTAAEKKRLSEQMKKRWAERKAAQKAK